MAGAEDLHEAATELMEYLAFMAGVGNREYPFKPSPEGERKLQRVKTALKV
jgi:hypothetical protein